VTNWNVLRAAGIGSYLMLWSSVAWGLAATTAPFGKRVSKPTAALVHQFMSTCGLFLLAVHMGALLIDRFIPFGVADLFVPMSATYRPIGVLLGVIAMYATVIVIVTSWLRKPMGTKWWRRFHLLAIPIFVLSMLHGILTGTDSSRPTMWWMYVGTGLITAFLVIVRALTIGLRPERKAPPPHARHVPAPVGIDA
jgi:sulfoxide reductase heme-binding subunit YedZ